MAATLPANIDSLRRIVAEHQAYRLHWPASDRLPKATRCLVDATTANAVVSVYDGLSADNQAKALRLVTLGPDKLSKLAAIAWGK